MKTLTDDIPDKTIDNFVKDPCIHSNKINMIE